MLSRLRRGARQLLTSSPPRPRLTSPSPLVLPRVTDPVQETFGLCPPSPILHVDRCPVCGSPDATRDVCRYNKFITYEHIPDAACVFSDFALCHACGVVYATRRPAGERYEWLLDHFEETIGRTAIGEQRSGKLTLSSYALTPELHAE